MNHISISDETVVRVNPKQMAAKVGEGTVILGMQDSVYYGLDEVGTRIWSLLQQPCTVRAVRDVLLEEYEVEPDVCMTQLVALLYELAGRGLIDVTAP